MYLGGGGVSVCGINMHSALGRHSYYCDASPPFWWALQCITAILLGSFAASKRFKIFWLTLRLELAPLTLPFWAEVLIGGAFASRTAVRVTTAYLAH